MNEELKTLEHLACILECAAIDYMGEAKTELGRLCEAVYKDPAYALTNSQSIAAELNNALSHYDRRQYREGSSILSRVNRRIWKQVMQESAEHGGQADGPKLRLAPRFSSAFGSGGNDMTGDTASINSGRCRCGAYRFLVFGEPFGISYCHCSDCRKSTGSPVSVFAGFKNDDVKISGEKAASYKSIPEVDRLFCSLCGTPIGYQDTRLPGEIYYYIGVLEEQSKVAPQLHAWVSERLEWLNIADDLPRYQHFSRPR